LPARRRSRARHRRVLRDGGRHARGRGVVPALGGAPRRPRRRASFRGPARRADRPDRPPVKRLLLPLSAVLLAALYYATAQRSALGVPFINEDFLFLDRARSAAPSHSTARPAARR